VTAIDFRVT